MFHGFPWPWGFTKNGWSISWKIPVSNGWLGVAPWKPPWKVLDAKTSPWAAGPQVSSSPVPRTDLDMKSCSGGNRSKLKNLNIRNESSCQGQSLLSNTHLQKNHKTFGSNDLNLWHPSAEKGAAGPLRNAARIARWGRRTEERDMATAPLKCALFLFRLAKPLLRDTWRQTAHTHTHMSVGKTTC